ncbi:hypothetical protein [Paenibacillus albiflavus]|uniref:hypothetical protein n=1 Tax=Paenibacillus albiflavus TaxID=2545760 RepID=UPI001404C1FA|nr:hypothetical protein [Paenibacillus albiflavus]
MLHHVEVWHEEVINTVWNKSGYHDTFTKQQMIIMDQTRKQNEERKKAEKKTVKEQASK